MDSETIGYTDVVGLLNDVFEVGEGGKSAQKVKIKVDFSFHLKIGKN